MLSNKSRTLCCWITNGSKNPKNTILIYFDPVTMNYLYDDFSSANHFFFSGIVWINNLYDLMRLFSLIKFAIGIEKIHFFQLS